MHGAFRKRWAAVLLALAACGASAQLVGSVKVEPAAARPGDPVTVTVDFDVVSGINCGLRLHFGDGTSGDYRINQAKDVPLVVRRAWPQAGSFTVKAEPKSQGLLPRCGGTPQEALLTVAAPSPPVAQPAPAAPPTVAAAPASRPAAAAVAPARAAGPCPAGWTVAKGGVARNGAYTCKAKPGTALPSQRGQCPGDLTYFENSRRGQLGCRT